MRCETPCWRVLLAVLAAGCTAAHDRDVRTDAMPAMAADASAPDTGVRDAGGDDASATGCAVGGGIGAPCSSDGDCTVHAPFAAPTCLPPGRGAPAGYCSSICMIDDECGPCARCVANASGTAPAPGWYGLCVRACDAADPCDVGTVCAAIDGARAGCFPDCRSQPGLCGGGRCDASTGSCTLGCTVDSDCSDGGRCAAGRCQCGTSTTCLAGSACGATGTCGCTSDAACGAGHSCNASLPCCEWSPGLCS